MEARGREAFGWEKGRIWRGVEAGIVGDWDKRLAEGAEIVRERGDSTGLVETEVVEPKMGARIEVDATGAERGRDSAAPPGYQLDVFPLLPSSDPPLSVIPNAVACRSGNPGRATGESEAEIELLFSCTGERDRWREMGTPVGVLVPLSGEMERFERDEVASEVARDIEGRESRPVDGIGVDELAIPGAGESVLAGIITSSSLESSSAHTPAVVSPAIQLGGTRALQCRHPARAIPSPQRVLSSQAPHRQRPRHQRPPYSTPGSERAHASATLPNARESCPQRPTPVVLPAAQSLHQPRSRGPPDVLVGYNPRHADGAPSADSMAGGSWLAEVDERIRGCP